MSKISPKNTKKREGPYPYTVKSSNNSNKLEIDSESGENNTKTELSLEIEPEVEILINLNLGTIDSFQDELCSKLRENCRLGETGIEVTNKINKLGSNKMPNEETVAVDVFNTLRVPDVIKDMPKFDGNPRLLFEFINNVEEILTMIPQADGTSTARVILRAIRNKVVGPANEILNTYGTPLAWQAIKENLVTHYADKRNETSLIRDLHNIRQNHKTVEKFYSEVIEIQSAMATHVRIHETEATVIAAKKTLYSEMCLNTFLTGLREPLGSTIRAMKPSSLSEAFVFCTKEQNISYLKFDANNTRQTANRYETNRNQNHNFFSQQRSFNIFNNNQQFVHSHPPQQMNKVHNPLNNQRGPVQYPQQQQRPFNTFNPPKHNGSTQFSNRQRLPRPEPMETSTGYTHLRSQPQNQAQHNRAPSNFFRQTGPPRFTSEELHSIHVENPYSVNESTNDSCSNEPNNYYQELDNYYNYTDQADRDRDRDLLDTFKELDDSNFRIPCPTEQSDT